MIIKKKRVFVLLAIAFAVAGIVIINLSISDTASPVYSATNDALDLAIADGLKQADKEAGVKADVGIRAVIVPHHLVATKAIALGIKALAQSGAKRVVIISPDHFFQCKKMLCTTDGEFTTFFGDALISQEGADILLSNRNLVDKSNLFRDEHGIYTIVPFVRYYLPNAKVVPIVVSQKTIGDANLRAEILGTLKKLFVDKDTVIVISSDFSHYLPLADANDMDVKTIKSFCGGKGDEVLGLNNPSQSDCPLCLWIAMHEAVAGGFWNPRLIWHSNSANLLHDTSVASTTSHITLLLTSSNPSGGCDESAVQDQSAGATSAPEAKILFVGDMSFDRWIRQVVDRKGGDFIFSCIDPLLKGADFVVGNLEGPITSKPSVSQGSAIGSSANYILTFPPGTGDLLAKHNFKAVNIGNNHIGTFGREGLVSTHHDLNKAGIGFFGGLVGDEPIYRTEYKGIKLSFISYNEFGGSTPENVARNIVQEALSERIVIVYAHWGDEYSDKITRIQEVAKIFADAGANAIIGSHPHIVLPREYIGSTLVYYSLGNFIFDQYWDSKVSHGLTVLLHITEHGITADEQMVNLSKNGSTCY